MQMNDIHCLKKDYKGDVIRNESLDFLFPPVCPHCGASVATQGDWCETCFNDLLHIRHVPHKFLHYVDDVCVLADYCGGLKSMIYDVKFNEKKEQSKGAAPFLASYNFYMNYDESNIVQGIVRLSMII